MNLDELRSTEIKVCGNSQDNVHFEEAAHAFVTDEENPIEQRAEVIRKMHRCYSNQELKGTDEEVIEGYNNLMKSITNDTLVL